MSNDVSKVADIDEHCDAVADDAGDDAADADGDTDDDDFAANVSCGRG